jgi:hypothetical protein
MLFNLEPGVIGALRVSLLGKLFRMGSLVSQSAGNNWAKVHYTRACHESSLIPLWCSGFCSKLRAPNRGTSLGSCACGARASSLCSLLFP